MSPRGNRAEPLSKDFLEAGNKRLRAATSDEVNDLRREALALKKA